MRPVDYSKITEKKCSRCQTVKPASEFGRYDDPKQPINGWRYYAHCRDCSRLVSREYGKADRSRRNRRLKEWRAKNRNAALAKDQRARLKHKYGLTKQQVAALFAGQSGRCAICGQEKPLCIDHDHVTGKVRGGLCNRCNIVLGRYEKDLPAPKALTEKMLAGIRAYLANPPADSLLAGDGSPAPDPAGVAS